MTRFLVVRSGLRGQLHVVAIHRGAWLLACGRRFPASAVRVGRGAWDEDDARRCLDCSRTVSAAPGPRASRKVR